ncbi:hypothetical protein GCM10023190_22600 [Enteractinococcus fodinae]
MDYSFDINAIKTLSDCLRFGKVPVEELNGFSRKSFYSSQRLKVAIREIIDDHYLVALLQEYKRCMTTYVPGSTGKKYSHMFSVLVLGA